jgi:hypothetical protein
MLRISRMNTSRELITCLVIICTLPNRCALTISVLKIPVSIYNYGNDRPRNDLIGSVHAPNRCALTEKAEGLNRHLPCLLAETHEQNAKLVLSRSKRGSSLDRKRLNSNITTCQRVGRNVRVVSNSRGTCICTTQE